MKLRDKQKKELKYSKPVKKPKKSDLIKNMEDQVNLIENLSEEKKIELDRLEENLELLRKRKNIKSKKEYLNKLKGG